MVTFVPSFTSRAVRAHGLARAAAQADARQRVGADTTALRQELKAWDAAHAAPRATLSEVADHIEHVKRVAGAEHVGIGSDLDGVDDDLPVGLEDQAAYPALFAELIRRGWSDADLRKLAGENVLRALGRAEQVAKRLQKERPASTRTIQDMDGRPKM